MSCKERRLPAQMPKNLRREHNNALIRNRDRGKIYMSAMNNFLAAHERIKIGKEKLLHRLAYEAKFNAPKPCRYNSQQARRQPRHAVDGPRPLYERSSSAPCVGIAHEVLEDLPHNIHEFSRSLSQDGMRIDTPRMGPL